jgi:MFS transporter, PAT family, beta-lactamase induction signal transducer AmpG
VQPPATGRPELVDRRKIGLLALLYAAQGISPGFAAFAMPVLLRREGVSLQGVGLAGLLLAPVALKFVFGPWADRLAARGGLRAWLSALQGALAACLVGIALAPPGRSLPLFLGLVGAAYLVVAVLDVLTDGLAVRLLSPGERPAGNAAQYGGYYLGSIVAGGLFLAAEPRLGWVPAVGALAAIVATGWLAARVLTASDRGQLGVAGGAGSERASVLAFLRGPTARLIFPLLLLLDLPQNVGIALVGPFLLDGGLSQVQVGMVSGTVGLVAALAGAASGGLLLSRLRRRQALVTAGLLQGMPLLGFAWLGMGGALQVAPATVVVAAAYFTASLFNVALSSWFMDHLSPRQPATDYSVLACAHTATFVVANPIAGAAASGLGFTRHFLLAGACTLLLLAAAVPWLRRLDSRDGADGTPAPQPA